MKHISKLYAEKLLTLRRAVKIFIDTKESQEFLDAHFNKHSEMRDKPYIHRTIVFRDQWDRFLNAYLAVEAFEKGDNNG